MVLSLDKTVIFLMVIPRPFLLFLSAKMAARRIQLVFGKFVRILPLPELFTRIVKGTTETVIVDAAEQEIRNYAPNIRPSNHQDEKSWQEEATLTSSSHSKSRKCQPKFKNDQ